jgi:endonuclease YncB( thermonuclease family)
MRLTKLVISIFFIFNLSSCGHVAIADELRGIAYAVDGDTIRFNGQKKGVRIWGIDAPEKSQTCFDAQAQSYPCGVISKNALTAMIEGLEVVCQDKTNIDRFGRRVMMCEAGGFDIGATMVRYGYASDMPKYSKGFYALQEAQAKEEKAGIHGGAFQDPAEFRRTLRAGVK